MNILANIADCGYTPGDSNFLTQTLNILENFDLARFGPDSPTYRHLILETMRRAWVNYFAFPREPGLSSKDYAAEIASRIRLDKAGHDVQPVSPGPYQGGESSKPIQGCAKSVGGHDTTTLAVADRLGNVFNMLTSLGNTFGSYVAIPGTGIVMNDHMCNFDPVPGASSLPRTESPSSTRGACPHLFPQWQAVFGSRCAGGAAQHERCGSRAYPLHRLRYGYPERDGGLPAYGQKHSMRSHFSNHGFLKMCSVL